MSLRAIVTQRHSQDAHGAWIDSLENAYVRSFEALGMEVVPVSNATRRLDQALKWIRPERIILTGGGDVDDGRKRRGSSIGPRDRLEARLIHWAVRNNIPVLGICRGMQFLHVFFGGCLSRGVTGKRSLCHPKGAAGHRVRIVDPQLLRCLSGGGVYRINSYHDCGVGFDNLGKGLRVFAVGEKDGLVEGLHHERHPVAGIQWHPEREPRLNELERVLLRSFVKRSLFWEKKV